MKRRGGFSGLPEKLLMKGDEQTHWRKPPEIKGERGFRLKLKQSHSSVEIKCPLKKAEWC